MLCHHFLCRQNIIPDLLRASAKRGASSSVVFDFCRSDFSHRATKSSVGESWVCAARPDPTQPRPDTMTLLISLYLWNTLTDSRAVFFVRCRHSINFVFHRHRYPPVPATARGTCRVRGCRRRFQDKISNRKISKAIYRKTKYRSRKISDAQNIDGKKYRNCKISNCKISYRKITKMQNIEMQDNEGAKYRKQNIEVAKYRKAKYRSGKISKDKISKWQNTECKISKWQNIEVAK